jgi:hypothetical protein
VIVTIRYLLPPGASFVRPLQDSVCPKTKHLHLAKGNFAESPFHALR